MECFSTERHKNFINAILEDHFVLPPAEPTSDQEKNLQEVDYKTPEISDTMPLPVNINMQSKDKFS